VKIGSVKIILCFGGGYIYIYRYCQELFICLGKIKFKNNYVSLLKSCEFHENRLNSLGKNANKFYLFSTVFVIKFNGDMSFMKFGAVKDLFK
jgi:hypothetical protein